MDNTSGIFLKSILNSITVSQFIGSHELFEPITRQDDRFEELSRLAKIAVLAQHANENPLPFLNRVLEFSNENFDPNEATVDDVREILKRGYFWDKQGLPFKEGFSVEEMRKLAGGSAPVSVLREVVGVHKVRFRIMEFMEYNGARLFLKNYTNVILSS